MQFRKVLFGGYDKKEVQAFIDSMKTEYESKAEVMKKEFEAKIDSMQADFDKMQKDLTAENESLVVKQQEMRVAYKEYCEKTLQQYANSLRSLSNEFSQILDNVVNLQKEIGSKDIYDEMDRALEMKQVMDMLEDVEKED